MTDKCSALWLIRAVARDWCWPLVFAAYLSPHLAVDLANQRLGLFLEPGRRRRDVTLAAALGCT